MLNVLIKFSSENIVILLILLAVVVVITIVAFLVDNKNRKYNKIVLDNTKEIMNATKEKEVTEKLEVIKEEPVKEKEMEVKEEIIVESAIKEEPIAEALTEQEKAKQELKKIEQELSQPKEEHIGPTDFEKEQEKTAIINYEELKKAALDVDAKDQKLLEDEGNEPISIDDLYQLDSQKKVEMMDFKTKQVPKEISSEIKFKNSEVLSPVFGVTKEEKNLIKDISALKDIKDVELKSAVELEIAKTERFLKELKELRSKLD